MSRSRNTQKTGKWKKSGAYYQNNFQKELQKECSDCVEDEVEKEVEEVPHFRCVFFFTSFLSLFTFPFLENTFFVFISASIFYFLSFISTFCFFFSNIFSRIFIFILIYFYSYFYFSISMFRYSQEGIGNLRRCIVSIRNSLLVVHLSHVRSLLRFILDPIRLGSMRAHEIASKVILIF